MDMTDQQLAVLNSCVYYGGKPSGSCRGFRMYRVKEAKHGFAATMYIKVEGNCGAAAFIFRGTDLGKSDIGGQLMSDFGLSQDPDEDMRIIEEASRMVRNETKALEQDFSGVDFLYYTSGHSLGALSATAVTIQFEEQITRCVTFDTPGIIKFWRKKACDKGEDLWKRKIINYLSYPNIINTALPKVGTNLRLEMGIHTRMTLGHAARCIIGSGMRVMIWVSLANLAGSLTGRTKGFWAAKVVAASNAVLKLLLKRAFRPSRMLKEGQAAADKDEAKKDAQSAEKTGKTANDRSHMFGPILARMPPRFRSAVITGFWATVTVGASSTGYVMTRTGGNLKDSADEHNILSFIDGFDEKTGKPRLAIEMACWPHHRLLLEKGFTKRHSGRVLREGLLPLLPTSYGVHNILSRKKLLLRRARSLPGYKELGPLSA